MFFGGRPLTRDGKRIAGSSKMAAGGGSVIWGERPLDDMGKSRAQQLHKEETEMMLERNFNDDHITIYGNPISKS